MLSTSNEHRIQLEFTNRKRMAWPCFYKHKKILINQSISLKSRLKFFDACVTPTILFGLHCLPLPQKLISQLDVIQRKMLRAIVGWRRAPDETWRETMIRMNDRVLYGMTQHYCESWAMLRSRNLWRYAIHISKSDEQAFPRRVVGMSGYAVDDPASPYRPYRGRGRPRPRWDDLISDFCQLYIDQHAHWLDALNAYGRDARELEQTFMIHVGV